MKTNEFDSIANNMNLSFINAHIASMDDCNLIIPDDVYNSTAMSNKLYWPLIFFVDNMMRVGILKELLGEQ